VLNPLEGFLALASLAVFLRPPRWAPALLLAGPLAAALRGEATSPLYALLPLAFSGDRLSLLHGFLIYLASSLSPPAAGQPVWSLALILAAGLLLGAGSRYALAAATVGLALRLISGVQTGDLWSWSSPDIALAALWVLAWAVRHLGDAPRMWVAYGALSLFFDGTGGVSAAVASAALALWEFMRWRPPFSPLGVAALGGSLLALLTVGSSAWLRWAGLGLFGNVFVDAYGPALGAAALGGVAAFLAVARGPLAASAVSIFFVFSAAAYFAGLRLYPDSTALTNILMPALAASSLYAAVVAALARRGPRWRAVHVLAFLALGLLSASGPYLYNPSYVKFALAAPGSVVWTLEPPPYPAKIELSGVTYHVDSGRVPVEGCGPVPRAVVAVLDVAVDGVWTKVEVRYGVEEALGLRAPLGFALAGDYLVVVGPTYGEGGASSLSAMYWNATGGCLGRGGETPRDYLVGVRPLPFFRIIIATLVALAAATALPPRRLGSVGRGWRLFSARWRNRTPRLG
jgi:hypothetical protein